MMLTIRQEQSDQMERTRLLRGRISKLRRTKVTRDFMRTENQRIATDIGTVALGLSGMTALSVGLAVSAGHSEEEVDKVEFDIDGVHVEGWLWRCPFRENDEVEVVAEQTGAGVTCFAVRRVEDGLIAVYPHCTSGRQAYLKTVFKVCLSFLLPWIAVSAYLFFVKAQLLTLPQRFFYLGVAALIPALFLLFFAVSGYRKDRAFIALSEQIFATFGWENPPGINLKKTSKGKRRSTDGSGYGLWIFRR
ncbi:putative type VI secretion system effector [Paraburkholderia sp. J67]|uniref:putative type VI secretion system effector n=1 Tax=Paraburkholderia sp. J67 TaxID=2805435 RepID=UPI002ABD9F91|nr:putative type VI secretion system effector [Paraburkholderia sp. J67]